MAEPLTLIVSAAKVADDRRTQEPIIEIILTSDSTRRFTLLTQANVGRLIEIRGGGHTVRPVLRTSIEGGRVLISGFSSREQAERVLTRIAADRKIEEEAAAN